MSGTVWIVIGLLVIAVGSGLTIYGTRISNEEDSGRLEKEIPTTSGKLELLDAQALELE